MAPGRRPKAGSRKCLCLLAVVIAFVVVLKWDALFPDRRDLQILAPLTGPLGLLFLAKVVASAA